MNFFKGEGGLEKNGAGSGHSLDPPLSCLMQKGTNSNPSTQAYRRGMVFPRYLYITYYWWSEGWWLDESSCTEKEMIAATNRTIAIDYFPEALSENRDKPTDVGLVSTYVLDNKVYSG